MVNKLVIAKVRQLTGEILNVYHFTAKSCMYKLITAGLILGKCCFDTLLKPLLFIA